MHIVALNDVTWVSFLGVLRYLSLSNEDPDRSDGLGIRFLGDKGCGRCRLIDAVGVDDDVAC